MRILLLMLQTITFLAFTAAILLLLYLCANNMHEPNSDPLLARVIAFIFGSWIIDFVIFVVLALFNIWAVLSPLHKIEDPVRRTLQHLSLVFIQTGLLLAFGIAAFAVMFFRFI